MMLNSACVCESVGADKCEFFESVRLTFENRRYLSQPRIPTLNALRFEAASDLDGPMPPLINKMSSCTEAFS